MCYRYDDWGRTPMNVRAVLRCSRVKCSKKWCTKDTYVSYISSPLALTNAGRDGLTHQVEVCGGFRSPTEAIPVRFRTVGQVRLTADLFLRPPTKNTLTMMRIRSMRMMAPTPGGRHAASILTALLLSFFLQAGAFVPRAATRSPILRKNGDSGGAFVVETNSRSQQQQQLMQRRMMFDPSTDLVAAATTVAASMAPDSTMWMMMQGAAAADTSTLSSSSNLLSFSDQGQNLAGILFQASLLPYLIFLYFLSFRANRIPGLANFGFQYVLLFVMSTIPSGIISRSVYGISLADTDWLHGGAETLLTLANVLIVSGFRVFRVIVCCCFLRACVELKNEQCKACA